MKDDPVQGILFSRPQTVRFREVPLPPASFIGKAKLKTRIHALDPLTTALIRRRNRPSRDTELGNFIDYVVTKQK